MLQERLELTVQMSFLGTLEMLYFTYELLTLGSKGKILVTLGRGSVNL